MTVKKYNISIVGYTNTLPFQYGINQSSIKEQINLSLDIPSVCASKLKSGEVDLGLVPVALLPELSNYTIQTDYCIGAIEKVDSVKLFSKVELNKIETILLDYQSKTSINLVKILCQYYWNIHPKFVNASEGFENSIEGTTAAVIIGDRTFDILDTYPHEYDLSEEWYKYCNLPFVFACWVSTKEIDKDFLFHFNKALTLGVNKISEAVKLYTKQHNTFSVEDYLLNKISYDFSKLKQKGLDKFLDLLKRNRI